MDPYSIQQIPYFQCIIHNEQLSIICLQKTCLKNMLVCPLCEETQHSNHKTQSFKQYLTNLKFQDEGEMCNALLKESEKITEVHMKIKKEVDVFRTQINDQLNELSCKVDRYFQLLANQLLEIHQHSSALITSKSLSKLTTSTSSPQQLMSFLERLHRYTNLSYSNVLKYYHTNSNYKFSQMVNLLNKIKANQHFSKIKQNFLSVSPPFTRMNYKWSAFKASKININDTIALQTCTSSSNNGERFALVQTDQACGGDINVAFRIIKLKGWIGIGICLKEAIVKAGYKFNYTLPLHGSYLISANGYSWSHSQPQYNSTAKSFSFAEGEVIRIYYDSINKTLTFKSEKGKPSFQLSILEPPVGDYYVPCVNLCNMGDEVQLYND